MPAMTIFAMSIRFLKQHFWEAVTKQKVGLEETDVRYVITIPAIWDDNAKQFMREAAVEVCGNLFKYTSIPKNLYTVCLTYIIHRNIFVVYEGC